MLHRLIESKLLTCVIWRNGKVPVVVVTTVSFCLGVMFTSEFWMSKLCAVEHWLSEQCMLYFHLSRLRAYAPINLKLVEGGGE